MLKKPASVVLTSKASSTNSSMLGRFRLVAFAGPPIYIVTLLFYNRHHVSPLFRLLGHFTELGQTVMLDDIDSGTWSISSFETQPSRFVGYVLLRELTLSIEEW